MAPRGTKASAMESAPTSAATDMIDLSEELAWLADDAAGGAGAPAAQTSEGDSLAGMAPPIVSEAARTPQKGAKQEAQDDGMVGPLAEVGSSREAGDEDDAFDGDDGEGLGDSELNMTKQCAVCGMSPSQPMPADRVGGSERRPWALRHNWGPLCRWCKKASAIRWPFWNTPKFMQWLQSSPSSRTAAQEVFWGYYTLREEGKVHVTTAMLTARAEMIRRLAIQVPAMLSSTYTVAMPMDEYQVNFPDSNPIESGLPVVQLQIMGHRRLGIQVPCEAKPGAALAGISCKQLAMHPSATSDRPEDLHILSTWCEAAAANAAAATAAAPTDRSPGKMSVHSPRTPKSVGPGGSDAGAQTSDAEEEEMDDEGEHRMQNPSVLDRLPKKGPHTASVRRLHVKLGGILTQLTTPEWRQALKLQHLRSLLRSCAGAEKEVKSSDSPMVICLSGDHVRIAEGIMTIQRCLRLIAKEIRSATSSAHIACPSVWALSLQVTGFPSLGVLLRGGSLVASGAGRRPTNLAM